MSSPQNSSAISSSPTRSVRLDIEAAGVRIPYTDDPHASTSHPRRSPTLVRGYDPNHPDAQERQRTMDVASAMSMQLSRARSASMAMPTRPRNISPNLSPAVEDYAALPSHDDLHEDLHTQLQMSPVGFDDSAMGSMQHLNQGHDPMLIVSETHDTALNGLPMYQANIYRSTFDFAALEMYSAEEKTRLGLVTSQQAPPTHGRVDSRISHEAVDEVTPDTASTRMRQRKLSLSISSRPRRQGGKMALFEGEPALGRINALPPFDEHASFTGEPSAPGSSSLAPPIYHSPSSDRPYRFSFYSNALPATIHARSLSELPAEGQSFEDLFSGVSRHADRSEDHSNPAQNRPMSSAGATPIIDRGAKRANGLNNVHRAPDQFNAPSKSGAFEHVDGEPCTWWLDVTSPTDEEMKLLSKVFSIHPLTTEDIQMEEAREKIELFRNYYLVCFRSFDQDPYSPTYLEPLNMYIVVFREGTLSFHFRATPHPQNVRRRIKQLKDYINVTSDWISYALIDDITDAFGPLIQSIEYEVDSIDELVLILKEAEQSDMLRRIGTCRKKVMGLLRLMGNKADVVKGLAKRCNENWSVAPKSDIGLYLSDIQDHLITMTQNLNHYEKILSRSHSNYLAQISIEMTDANNQINDVLSKLTALGTVLIPMNLVTGLWGMNVHVPGQDDVVSYTWFASIIGGLAAFAIFGGYFTYRLMLSRR